MENSTLNINKLANIIWKGASPFLYLRRTKIKNSYE